MSCRAREPGPLLATAASASRRKSQCTLISMLPNEIPRAPFLLKQIYTRGAIHFVRALQEPLAVVRRGGCKIFCPEN